MSSHKRIGRVKFFDSTKGFGFIEDLVEPGRENDVYFNRESTPKPDHPDGQIVVFEALPSEQKPGTLRANTITPVGETALEEEELLELATKVSDEEKRRQVRSIIRNGKSSTLRETPSGGYWMVGRVKFFDATKEFGFIEPLRPVPEADKDVYVNEHHVCSPEIADGDFVTFQVIPSRSRSGSVQAGKVEQFSDFSGDAGAIRRLLTEDAVEPTFPSLSGLHFSALQTIPEKHVAEYAIDVLEKCRTTGGSEKIPSRIETLVDRLARIFGASQVPEQVRLRVDETVQTLYDQGCLEATAWLRLFLKQFAPMPAPEVLLEGLDDLSTIESGEVARLLTARAAQRYVEYALERFDESTNLSGLRGHLQQCHDIVREAFKTEPERQSKIERQLEKKARRHVDRGHLSPEDAVYLQEKGVISELPTAAIVSAVGGSKRLRRKVVAYLKGLEVGQLEGFFQEGTRSLLGQTRSGSNRQEAVEEWLRMLRSVVKLKAGKASNEDVRYHLYCGETSTNLKAVYQTAARLVSGDSSPERQVQLYVEGLVGEAPAEWIFENISTLEWTTVEKIVRHPCTPASARASVLRRSVEYLPSSYKQQKDRARSILRAAKEHLNGLRASKVTEVAVRALSEKVHLSLWEEGVHDIQPEEALRRHFTDMSAGDVEKAREWCQSGRLSASEVRRRLYSFLQGLPDRYDPQSYPPIEEAADLVVDEESPIHDQLSECTAAVCDMVYLSRWVRGDSNETDLKTIQRAFVALPSAEQILGLRRLFWMHARGKVTLDLSDISRLSDVDLDDLASTNFDANRMPLSLPVEIVVKTLQKVEEEGELLLEGECLKLALYATANQREVNLRSLFNSCTGRTTISMPPKYQEGQVEEVRQGGRRHFKISFPYKEHLVQAVKSLPGRRYHPKEKVWTIPGSNEAEKEVIEFAREHNFFLELDDGKRWSNNLHLHKLEDEIKPCRYCEGRKAKKKHGMYGREFWWCRNSACFRPNRSTQTPDDWRSYTLLDFLSLMGIGLSDGPLDHQDYGRYMGTMNRFHALLERLECRSCGDYMHPVQDSAYAHYRVTSFHCVNERCDNYEMEVYLHHCLNCSSIIDSRDTEQCPNGWWICTNDRCGACCSTETMRRRINYRERVGMDRSHYLREFVDRGKGHMERAEYFCHSCGTQMVWLQEISDDCFRCEECGVEYNIKRDWERPEKQNRRRIEGERRKKALEQHQERRRRLSDKPF